MLKLSFSTLACPDWTLSQAIEMASSAGYDGLELRFLENEDSLWKLPCFQGMPLKQSRTRIVDAGLSIACVDTSCRFDSPNRDEREIWIVEGQRMAELAARLGSPGIRVFGDRVHANAHRISTRGWIVESLKTLAERISGSGVQVWLETHGDFSTASEVQAILKECPQISLVWDAASAFAECGERPFENGRALQQFIRHVHVKDLRWKNGLWSPALMGEGEFPLGDVHSLLAEIEYGGFLSFEWEKKWHPEIEAPEIAVPHFTQWFRKTWTSLGYGEHSAAREMRG